MAVEDINKGYEKSTDLVEQAAYRVYGAQTGELPRRMAELQMVVELRRSQAAEHLADLIMSKIPGGSPLVTVVENCLNEFLAQELTNDIFPPEAA